MGINKEENEYNLRKLVVMIYWDLFTERIIKNPFDNKKTFSDYATSEDIDILGLTIEMVKKKNKKVLLGLSCLVTFSGYGDSGSAEQSIIMTSEGETLMHIDSIVEIAEKILDFDYYNDEGGQCSLEIINLYNLEFRCCAHQNVVTSEMVFEDSFVL